MLIPDDLYTQIIRSMPIPCIDLIVLDSEAFILMVKRAHQPAIGEWWFPGGRIHFGELREKAIIRKLKEECGVSSFKKKPIEILTHDVFLTNIDGSLSHGVTTVYQVEVEDQAIFLDAQSESYCWKKADNWLKEDINVFLKTSIKAIKW